MTTNYPGTLDNFTNPTPTDYEDVLSHSGQHSNANDAIEAMQGVMGTTAGTAIFTAFTGIQKALNYLGTPSAGDAVYYNGTSWVSLAAGTAAAGKYLTTNGTTPSWSTVTSGYGTDGWIPYPGTLLYASGTTMTAAVNETALWKKGVKIKCIQGGTQKYFYGVNSAFASGTTTVTVLAGTNYSLANAAISSVYYSYADAQGHPDYFDVGYGTWTTSGTAFTNQPTTPLLRIAITENRAWLWGIFLTSGTSGGSGQFRLALTAGNVPNQVDNSLGNAMNVSDTTMTGVCTFNGFGTLAIQKYDGTRIAGNSAYFTSAMTYMY